MAVQQAPRSDVRRRHRVLILASTVALVAILAIFFVQTRDDGLTPAADLAVGECFLYPGDGNSVDRVGTVPCSEMHFAEVYGLTAAGDTDSCVGLFEAYTGAGNYWETGYIIGFIDVDDSQMLCYLYGPEDFAGSLRNGL